MFIQITVTAEQEARNEAATERFTVARQLDEDRITATHEAITETVDAQD